MIDYFRYKSRRELLYFDMSDNSHVKMASILMFWQVIPPITTSLSNFLTERITSEVKFCLIYIQFKHFASSLNCSLCKKSFFYDVFLNELVSWRGTEMILFTIQ